MASPWRTQPACLRVWSAISAGTAFHAVSRSSVHPSDTAPRPLAATFKAGCQWVLRRIGAPWPLFRRGQSVYPSGPLLIDPWRILKIAATGQSVEPRKKGAEQSPATLGDVLYAKSKAVVPEADWAALVRSIAAGDQLALHALYERAHRMVFTLAMRITANRETAEELTVDVFHDVWRRRSPPRAANGTVLGLSLIHI